MENLASKPTTVRSRDRCAYIFTHLKNRKNEKIVFLIIILTTLSSFAQK